MCNSEGTMNKNILSLSFLLFVIVHVWGGAKGLRSGSRAPRTSRAGRQTAALQGSGILGKGKPLIVAVEPLFELLHIAFNLSMFLQVARLVILDNVQLDKENQKLRKQVEVGKKLEDQIDDLNDRIVSLQLHRDEIQKNLDDAKQDLDRLEKEKKHEEERRLEVEKQLQVIIFAFAYLFIVYPYEFYATIGIWKHTNHNNYEVNDIYEKIQHLASEAGSALAPKPFGLCSRPLCHVHIHECHGNGICEHNKQTNIVKNAR